MVADGIHILLGVALVALLARTDRVEAYLVVILAAGLPDLDRYLFSPLVYGGYLSGPIWTHRGITHSLAVLCLVIGVGHLLGYWRPAAIGYGSHLIADFLTGSIRLGAPFTTRPYGLHYDWMLGNIVLGAFATLVVVAELAVRVRDGQESAGIRGWSDAMAITLVGRLRRWFR